MPITRVLKWLDENCYQFIYDDSYTKKECDKIRKEKKEEELLKLLSKKKQ